MIQGKIKIVAQKGYGFITIEGREKDLFFHASSVKNQNFNNLKPGDDVEVESIDETPKGDQAVSVRVLY